MAEYRKRLRKLLSADPKLPSAGLLCYVPENRTVPKKLKIVFGVTENATHWDYYNMPVRDEEFLQGITELI